VLLDNLSVTSALFWRFL